MMLREDTDRAVGFAWLAIAAAGGLIAVVASCVPANADLHEQLAGLTYEQAQELTFFPSDDPEAFGTILLENRNLQGSKPGIRVRVVDTPFGPVTLEHNVTLNLEYGCGYPCPDTLEVIDMPGGMIARPPFIEVEEGSSATIQLLPYLGG